MARHYSGWRRTSVLLTILTAATWNAQAVRGQTEYQFVNPTNTATADWHDSAHWNPAGIPDNPGDGATFTRPPVNPSAGFTVLANEDTTIGSITIDSTSYTNNHNFTIDGGGALIFQTASGSASYTETAGGSGNERITVWNNITVMSDVVMTFEHRDSLNSSSLFHGVITGASGRTITKEGTANWQLSAHLLPGYQGKYIINNGGIRFTGSSNIDDSSGVTVNSGGQLQFNANTAAPTYDWSLADGAVLTLNGPGKSDGSATQGALRFQGQADQADTHARFHSPVVLDSDSRIAVGPPSVSGELTNVVSGDGGLTVWGGELVLSNPANSYAGNTALESAGSLSLVSPFLADAADVLLATGTALNLNFSDTDVIRSLYIDGVAQEPGLWGATGNIAAEFTTDLITGTGLLDVSVGGGVPGDYNNDGSVDAADYVLWRKDPDAFGGPQGYDDWVANFGSTSGGGSGAGALAAVPEPLTSFLVVTAIGAMLGFRLRRE